MGRAEFYDLQHSLDKCSYEMERALTVAFDNLDLARKNASRDVLKRVFPAVVRRYSLMSGKLAKDYYLAERLSVSGEHFPAIVADVAESDQLDEAVRYACGHLYKSGELEYNPKLTLKKLVASADRFMRERAYGTIVANAAADPFHPKCRRYVEAGACDYCIERGTDSYAGPLDVATGLHDGCRCSVDVDFDGSKQREDEEFALSVLQDEGSMSEYEERYVTREINCLWYKFKDEPSGMIYVGDYGYMFDIVRFNEYQFRWKRRIE